MTDPHPPLSDEDLSAVLDGEAPPDVVARAQEDPRARARLAELEEASSVVRRAGVPPVDADTVDRLVAAALDAAAPAPHRQDPGVVTPLPARPNRQVPPLLVAAVVAVLAGVGLTLVFVGRGGDTGEETASNSAATEQSDDGAAGDGGAPAAVPEDAPAEGSERGDAPLAEEGAPGSGDTTSPPAPVVDLGSFASTDELRAALREAFPADQPGESSRLTTANVARCAEQLGIVLDQDDPPRHTGEALVDGELLVVFEFDSTSLVDGEPTALVTAAQPATCNPVATFER